MQATKEHMPKVGDVIRVKHWKLGELNRQVKEVDLKQFAIRADDGEVYMLCNELDNEGPFFF